MFLFSSGKYLEVELLDHMVVLLLMFWGISIWFSIAASPIYIHSNGAQGFPFLHILPTLVICCLFLKYKFVYLFFIYLFLAALGLHCCTWAFSSCSEWGGVTLCCGAQASHCGGFSCCGAWALGMRTSVVVACGVSSCSSQALETGSVVVLHRLLIAVASLVAEHRF